ncbi:hypothetical protein QBC40DRAFT_278287 [Triangularia verruculosa]|uniref:Arrestin-like N-terminal domain-containing protein n=1 Tax=Triangularia verruculosa TaxID=2587418 RepID=A0AAN6XJJ5_9PEZI|nr:hypothetical protein QBC40DRAFT_278287 [Triangularia verruculosa]
MSIRIALENPPEFYTNLDVMKGHVVLTLSRQESVGAVIVKLEGESRTALGIPNDNSSTGVPHREMPSAGDIIYENHKILYKVAQAFPHENAPPQAGPIILNPGQHHFPFQFKFPFNNSCGNAEAMAKIGGVVSAGGFAPGAGLFGLGGIRVMDGTKQLMYSHVTKTLPPSFTGFPGEAEIRYYVKVTIQRPGLFKENWRYQIGLKFLPIEPPRPPKSNQEAYARRPFAFQPRTPPSTAPPSTKKRTSFFGRSSTPQPPPPVGGPSNASSSTEPSPATPPSIEMSARLPHPAILTCNKPVPLRLIAKKLAPSNGEVYLIAVQIDLIGKTIVRCQDLVNTEINRWVIVSRQGLSIPVSKQDDAVGTEVILPDAVWNNVPLPNTVMPSFLTCNLSREYSLEVKLGLAWGKPDQSSHGSSHNSSLFGGSNRNKGKNLANIPQEIHLPLNFSNVQVFSGLTPPAALVEAMRQGRTRPARKQTNPNSRPPPQQPNIPPQGAASSSRPPAPALPPRPVVTPQQQQQQQNEAETASLYPPQLRPEQEAPPYDDAPPTYEEAMAEEMTGPVFPSTARPAYSGVTDENAASSLPEKN